MPGRKETGEQAWGHWEQGAHGEWRKVVRTVLGTHTGALSPQDEGRALPWGWTLGGLGRRQQEAGKCKDLQNVL